MAADVASEFRANGVAMVRDLVDTAWIAKAGPLIDGVLGWPDTPRAGVRHVLAREPRLGELACDDRIADLMESLCGRGVRVVRAIVFDKSPEANWAVPWHQDATVAVRDRMDVAGFGPWSIKAGEHHCQPSREVLDRIVTVRLHLDPCGPQNGPLRVVPRSHRFGLVGDSEVDGLVNDGPVVGCTVAAGDAVVMHPHVVHSSPRAEVPARRRVLHLDCTSTELPSGLRWAEDVPLRRCRVEESATSIIAK